MAGTGEKEDLRKGSSELRKRFAQLVEAMLDPRGAAAPGAIVDNARALVQRKLSTSSSKHDTRILLQKLIEERLRTWLASAEVGAGDAATRGELVLSTIIASGLLAEFAASIDRVVLECSAPTDYSFAGRADFIGLEEILQLLSSGKHSGCLTLERPDNRIDVYLDRGTVAFLDPHRFIRRVLPAPGGMGIREIRPDMLQRAEVEHAESGTPIVVTLHKEGFFREEEVREVVRQLGLEVLFDFLREQASCTYSYRQLDQLPVYAVGYDLRLSVTPILLEGNKRLDDWRSMAKVFPDPDEPLQPVPDMIARISSLNLSVVEIKMLAQVHGRMTPRKLAPAMGLPLTEIYQHLIRFAKEGVLVPPGGNQSLEEVAMSIEESVQLAFQALDANDDQMAVSSALDKVLGFDDDSSGRFELGGRRRLLRSSRDDDEDPDDDEV